MARTPPKPQTPEFVTFDGLTLVGKSEHFTPETRAKIPGHCERCVAAFGDTLFGRETFGVCHDIDDHDFSYLVGVADDGREVEGRSDRLRIPPGRYAVFHHDGHISTISDTWSAIFDEWLPGAGLTPNGGSEFERYARDFDPSKVGGVSIWIPVEG